MLLLWLLLFIVLYIDTTDILIVSFRVFGAAIADYTLVGTVSEVAMITDVSAVWQPVCTIATRTYQYQQQ